MPERENKETGTAETNCGQSSASWVKSECIDHIRSGASIWCSAEESEVAMKKKFKFDDYEIRILILALNELRNQLIKEERYTDAVDELLIKLFD